MELESHTIPLIESLVQKLKALEKIENNNKETEVEWIIITGRKVFSHAYKIKSNSNIAYVQKIYFTTVELKDHILNALKYPNEYLWSLFSEFVVNLQIIPTDLRKMIDTYKKELNAECPSDTSFK
jgi:hypothetical protein